MTFDNHAARISANMVASYAKDMGMTGIVQWSDGTVIADIGNRAYLMGWDVDTQQVRLLGTLDLPPKMEIRSCA